MVDSNVNMEEWVKAAKEAFNYYSIKNKTKMCLEEFDRFIKDFLKDEQELLEKFHVKTVFEEFAMTHKEFMEPQEFEEAWVDIKISRMKTRDHIE